MSERVDIRDVDSEQLLNGIMFRAAELSRRWSGTPRMYEANKVWRKAGSLLESMLSARQSEEDV
jgi:hypothetical protein